MLETEGVRSIRAYVKKLGEQDPKAVRLVRYQQKLEEFEQQAKALVTTNSYFEVDRVVLGSGLPSDPTVKAMVDKVIEKWGEPGRLMHQTGQPLVPNLP